MDGIVGNIALHNCPRNNRRRTLDRDGTTGSEAGTTCLVTTMEALPRHIEIIPEVQSLSHSYYLCCAHPEIAERQDDPWPDTYCPSNPKTYELLFDVMDEVIAAFKPRIMHIGHDEAYTFAICPRCQDRSSADLLAGDINTIHEFLASRGVRPFIWCDKLTPLSHFIY